MKFTYPKKQKLKLKSTINSLFSEGQSVSKYPLRLVYIPLPLNPEVAVFEQCKIGVSVSKRNFKKAVDRNYFKRILRESYRLNQQILSENLSQPFAIMLFYQTKDRLTSHEINQKMILLLEKFVKSTSITEETAQ